MYGNGRMITDFPAGPINGQASGVCNNFGAAGTGRLGVDLSQLMIAPTYALTANHHSVGISVLIG